MGRATIVATGGRRSTSGSFTNSTVAEHAAPTGAGLAVALARYPLNPNGASLHRSGSIAGS